MTRKGASMITGNKGVVRRRPSGRTAVKRRAGATPPVDDPAGELEAWLARHGVREAKVGGFDIDGVWRGKYVSLEKLLSSVRGEGLAFCDVIFGWDVTDTLLDNTAVTGWHSGYPDLSAFVDVSSARLIPWEPGTAAFLLDFFGPDKSPFAPSPRQLLQRVGRDARDMGFLPKMGAEFEYFLFRETPQSLHQKGFRHLEPLSPGMFGYSWLRSSEHAGLVHAVMDGCNAFGIPVEGMHTETGPGVYETALRYGDLEAAADAASLFKTAVKELCARQGVAACFMAKVDASLPGCSGHLHQSLWDLEGQRNLFHDAQREGGMSATLRHYVGGQLALMPELTALYWPNVNSYKRRIENTWAPTRATWGVENRTCAIRAIGGGAKATRLEFRQPGADANPYLSMAVSLAAGLWGIRNQVEPPPPVHGNAYEASGTPLPRSLREALALLQHSRTAREILGDGFVEHYCRTREWEARQGERAVTDWERERYFELA